jgi:hypothetical protein
MYNNIVQGEEEANIMDVSLSGTRQGGPSYPMIGFHHAR